jgi:outer membrane protein
MKYLICIALLLIPVVTLAQQSGKIGTRIGVDETNPLSLQMSDVIRLALENNREIEIERVNVQQAGSDLLTSKGAFDPALNLSQFFTRQLTPVTSSLGGSSTGVLNTKTFNGEFSLRGLLPSGGNYDLSATASRADTSNLFATLNPQTSTGLNFTFRQPLLRNREIDDARRRIRVAQRRLDISDSQFRQRVIEIISQAQRAYWDLVFARQNVDIARESVALAETQLERAQRLIEAGTQAQIDLVQVEAQLRRRQEDVLTAIESVTRAENALKLIILQDRAAPEWKRAIVPTDTPQMRSFSFDLDAAVASAISNRPEIRQLETQKEIAGEDIRYFRNQGKPQIDLVAGFGLAGLAGTQVSRANPFSSSNTRFFARINEISNLLSLDQIPLPPPATVPDFLVGGLGQSLSNLFGERFSTFRIGFQIQLPLRNRTAAGQLARAEFESRKASIQQQRAENLIENEVRNALQSVRTTQERIQAAQAARVAAEQQLESEQRRYEAGLSTNFLVLTRQQELSEARGRELRALTDYDKAIAELQRATGATLSTYNVEIKPTH